MGVIEWDHPQRLCMLLQEMARRRGRTANCAQYRDYYTDPDHGESSRDRVGILDTIVNFPETCEVVRLLGC